jgi:hypothetical protein
VQPWRDRLGQRLCRQWGGRLGQLPVWRAMGGWFSRGLGMLCAAMLSVDYTLDVIAQVMWRVAVLSVDYTLVVTAQVIGCGIRPAAPWQTAGSCKVKSRSLGVAPLGMLQEDS